MGSLISKREVGGSVRVKHSAAFYYCVFFVSSQVIILSLSSWTATTDWFLHHDAQPLLLLQGYAHRLGGTQCDIVITGDSTALADFIPSVIESRTGMKTCNIAEVRSIGDFVGSDEGLDAYLSRGHLPRYLLIGLTPTNLYLEHPKAQAIEPIQIQYALVYDRAPWLWHAMFRSPGKTLEWALWTEQALVREAFVRSTGQRDNLWRLDEREIRDRAGGAWAVTLPPQTGCEPPRGSFPASTRGRMSWDCQYFAKDTKRSRLKFWCTRRRSLPAIPVCRNIRN